MGPRRHRLHCTKRHFWILNVARGGKKQQGRRMQKRAVVTKVTPSVCRQVPMPPRRNHRTSVLLTPQKAKAIHTQSAFFLDIRSSNVCYILEYEILCCQFTHTCLWTVPVSFVFRKEKCVCVCVINVWVTDLRSSPSLFKLNVNKGAATYFIDLDGEMLPDQEGRYWCWWGYSILTLTRSVCQRLTLLMDNKSFRHACVRVCVCVRLFENKMTILFSL